MEILAPCNGPAHLKAAVYAGADAVYLGGQGFSARRNAQNFDKEELRAGIQLCRTFGVKVYVTVNILTRDDEWDDLRNYITELASLAPDALIVQDMGVAVFCRERIPDMPLFASTQMSIHSPEGVRFCSEAGFSRVILARECDKGTIQEIVDAANVLPAPIGIELFVHGALCVSVSGQCGLSAMIGGRSGNRGLCAQPCRMDFANGDRHYALSLKDLCLVDEVQQLDEMGICALKIEGRMRRPEYVAAAVLAYRAALAGKTVNMEDLRAVFSRSGFTNGYFSGDHRAMAGVRSREDVQDTTAVLPRLAELARKPSRRVPIDMDFRMAHNQPSSLRLSDGESTVTVQGPVPREAITHSTSEGDVARHLSRLGNTPFISREIITQLATGLMLSASEINGLRREACDMLIEERVRRFTPRYMLGDALGSAHGDGQESSPSTATTPLLRVHCQTQEQVTALQPIADQIVIPLTIEKAAMTGGEKTIGDPGRYVADEKALKSLLQTSLAHGITHLLCHNQAHAVIGRDMGFTLHGGLGLNVFNSRSAQYWEDYGFADLTASMELRLSEILAIKGGMPLGLAAYGKLPLMLLVRCPFDADCANCPGYLSDRTHRRFPLHCHGAYRDMLNADTLWMADRLHQLQRIGFLSLLLSDESPTEALAVTQAYRDGGQPPPGHTRGLLTRGVV